MLAEWGDRSQMATVLLGELLPVKNLDQNFQTLIFHLLTRSRLSCQGGRVRRVCWRDPGPRPLHGAGRSGRQDHRHQDLRQDCHAGEGRALWGDLCCLMQPVQ